MKEKDYNSIYEKLYKKYLEKYIKETEALYINIKKEGDTENYAYNTCSSALTKKRNGLKILNHPYDRLYSIFNNRCSLVQENNLNRLYTKHIIPRCEELNIEIKSQGLDKIIEEFAISEASKQVISWFSNWSAIYKMMFELNDFSEFEIIRNCNFQEGSEIFKKYHKKVYPNSYLQEENDNKKRISQDFNFGILDESKINISNLYNKINARFFNKDLTRLEDFENVLFNNWKTHSSKIYFKEYFETQQIAYLLKKLEKHFSNLNQTTIGNSLLFYIKNDENNYLVLTRENLASSFKSMNEKSASFYSSNIVKINNLNKILTKAQLD